MTENLIYCEHCGAKLITGANFCEVCGKQVTKPAAAQPYQAPPPAQPYQAPPAPAAPPPAASRVDPPYPEPAFASAPAAPAAQPYQPPQSKQKSILWPILGGGCCLGLLCGGLVAVALIIFANSPEVQEITRMLTPEAGQITIPTITSVPKQPAQNAEPPLIDPATVPNPEPTRTEGDKPTAVPVFVEDPVTIWPQDIGQELSDTYFTDDFSSFQFDWSDTQSDVALYGIEDGHYTIHVLQQEYTAWAYLPTEFDPTFIGFDAAVVPGFDNGAYGVMCYYQDKDNYYFVSIDPGNKEYSIGYMEGGEYYELMQNMWMPSTYLNDSPYAVNNIQVACDPDMITLYINNELEAQPSIETQQGGWVAITGETWKNMQPGGFKVLFDNLYAFIPVQ